MIKEYKRDFIEFLIGRQALSFGSFTLKSGRLSPYFLNTGRLYSGEAVNRLGEFYARGIMDSFPPGDFTTIFGPAYKGIPLAVIAVSALYRHFEVNVDYSYNRKEVKTHGDRGRLVGKKLAAGDRVLIVDDVITAGTAIRESLNLLKEISGVEVTGVMVSVDRMEKGTGSLSAIQELSRRYGIPVHSVVNIGEIAGYLEEYGSELIPPVSRALLDRLRDYRREYGVD
jgi:orotate phosphoribosyltransferase